MLKIPNTCLVDKIIPKNKIYKHEIKNDIVEKIIWLYKLSPKTLENITKSELEEIQILQIDVKEKKQPTNILKIIAKKIPYSILFVLKHDEDFCYAVFKNYIQYSRWNEEIEINSEGNTLEEIYDNIVESITKKNQYELSFNEIFNKEIKSNETVDNDIEKLPVFIDLMDTPMNIFQNNQEEDNKLKESLVNIAKSTILSQIEDRTIKFITDIIEELKRRNYSIEKINQLYIKDYKYTAFSYKCLNCVLNEVNEEKISIYKNLCIKGLTSKQNEIININKILIKISEMNYEEILYLQYFYYYKKQKLNDILMLKQKISDFLNISIKDVDRNQFKDYSINTLKNEGFLEEKTELITLYSKPKIIYEITPYGMKLVEKIFYI